MSTGQTGVRWFHGDDARLVVAVWVTRTGRTQFHSGLYHCDYGDPKVLHFASDRELCEDRPDELFCEKAHGLVALSLDDDDAQTLCALCRRVARKHANNLRYRLRDWRPQFDVTTGELNPPQNDDSYGFTCATFVLAMIRSAVVEELLLLEEWPLPERQDPDARWQRRVAQILSSSESSTEGVEKILAGIGSRRVHPTDVAGGAMHSRQTWPVGYADARCEGEKIAAFLR